MKGKFFVLGLFLLVSVFCVNIKTGNAETLWATCTIDLVNHTATVPSVRLTEINNVFQNKLFRITNQSNKQQLAIILTALSLGKEIRIAFQDGNPAHIELVGIVN